MKQLSVLTKKYIFPILVIITGLILVKIGIFPDKETGISQNDNFLYGALTILLMGVIILLYVLDVIKNRMFHLASILLLLIPLSLFLINSVYGSINNTIDQIERKKIQDKYVKQGLNDIKEIELEYKKKYGWFSSDFNELKRFMLEDSVYSISTFSLEFDSTKMDFVKVQATIPDTKITSEHQAVLGYNPMSDFILIESYDEDEALKCGLIFKDTTWENVLAKLFKNDLSETEERIFLFDIAKFKYVQNVNEQITFSLQSNILESDDEAFEFLYTRKKTNNFVSSNLVDKDEAQKHLYNTKESGLVLMDTISSQNKLKIGDMILSLNGKPVAIMNDLKEIIEPQSYGDTLSLEILRITKDGKEHVLSSEMILTPVEKVKKKNMNSLISYLEDKFSILLYNPDLFSLTPIENKFLSKEDEFSQSSLDTLSINKFRNYREKFSSSIFEFEKGKYFTPDNNAEGSFNFYTTSKIGIPVFLASDPAPYDPLNEKDTLKIGSLTDVKTNGNWNN